MKKIMKKRAGFTLVELLIVMIIIGILAGSMMLLVGSGTDRAQATKIMSDLRSLKAAAFLYYADNSGKGSEVPLPGVKSLDKYMDRRLEDMGKDARNNNLYSIKKGDRSDPPATVNNWYVVYTFPNVPTAIFADSLGVRKSLVSIKDGNLYDDLKDTEFKETSTAAVMLVRKP